MKNLTFSKHNNFSKSILLLGDSGAGKSRTGNTFCQKNVFDVGETFDSKTATFKEHVVDGLCVIDTPGFNDNRCKISDFELFENLL